MNMLARPGKASFHALADAASEPPDAPRQAHEPITPAPARGHVGPSLIGAGLSITGRLESAGDIQIEGAVEGEVRAHGVRIGSGAVVKGSVVGEIVQLAGTVEGNIEAETVIVAKTARISGDISYRSLQIEEGAYFSGNSRPRRKSASPPQAVEAAENYLPKGCYAAPSHVSTDPAPINIH